jgi:hypothetical protein
MSTSFYRYWLPFSIVFHLILLLMLRIVPMEVQQQTNTLSIISVSWENNVPQPEKKPVQLPVVIPINNKIVVKSQKEVPEKNTEGKYWGKSKVQKGNEKQPVTSNNSGKIINPGKFPDVIKSNQGNNIVAKDSDNDGTGSNRYGNNNQDSGSSTTAAKSGDSGLFYTNFSKNEDDFSILFQITVKNGKIFRVKQLSAHRNDGKDKIIQDKIFSGVLPVDPHCENDKMNVNISVTDGNKCHYKWE